MIYLDVHHGDLRNVRVRSVLASDYHNRIDLHRQIGLNREYISHSCSLVVTAVY